MKRIFDVALILLSAPLIMPAGLLIALCVALKLGRPALFIQTRPGLNGKPFRMYKFRTMTDERDTNGQLLPDHVRLTRFGRLLRSTSLDELPELLNVLRGEMSLVGPRPLLMQYLALYNDHQRRRHEVRPGITGWAQINGRNAISWEQKFDLDVWYVDNHSLWLDIRILFLTIWKVFKRDGISQEGEATAAPFTGSRPAETSTERH